jgi:hypothetical protein
MAGSASDYLESAVLNSVLRGQVFPVPSKTYIALFTADPTDANIQANEVSGSWYARQDIAQGGVIESGWTAPSNGVSTNAKVITFPAVTDSQVTVTYFGIYDAATAGNLLFHGNLATPKTLLVDDVLSFSIGALQIGAS